MKTALFLCLYLGLAGCTSDRVFSSDPLVNARPYLSAIPDDYDGLTPLPLIVTLHGFGENGYDQGHESGLQSMVNAKQFVLVAPDGTELVDETSGWFFSCCDEELQGVDDVIYLRAVIADVSTRYNINPHRIYITGHSNGAFMAYRMACEASDLVAAIAVHAGTFKTGEQDECHPDHALGILHIQGTEDEDVLAAGGSLDYGKGPISYLSAEETVNFWKTQNGCDDVETSSTLDGDSIVPGSETVRHQFSSCGSNPDVEYWEMVGSQHIQTYTENFASALVDFLMVYTRS